jgi:hypothetical protein
LRGYSPPPRGTGSRSSCRRPGRDAGGGHSLPRIRSSVQHPGSACRWTGSDERTAFSRHRILWCGEDDVGANSLDSYFPLRTGCGPPVAVSFDRRTARRP